MEDTPINVKIKLAALWTSIMFLYIYADYFGLYVPGKLQDILDGKMGPLGSITQGVLVGASIVVIIPSVMIFLSVALEPAWNRPLNLVVGVLYVLIILATMWRWVFYVVFGAIEVVLTGLVVWYSWKWPQPPTESSR